ncbi:STAS domain-containing protein [Streptomyces sp. NPDC001046]|uniref:STAS domain-containing protein n=1 Tax=unclassified Streptomyces TaxID=2593676 RepID=UPI00363A3FAB
MTNLPPVPFTVVTDRSADTLTVRVVGELDYDTSGDLLDAVVPLLSERAGLREVRLDFSGLTWIDSSGLSALLMVHRHTSAALAVLRLDHRPAFLERMLHLTNVLEFLTEPAAPAGARTDDVSEAEAT